MTEASHIHEGDTCPTCNRRVPHAKKKASPKTKVSSYRTPLDDAESHDEVAQAAAEALDIYRKPHWRWALNTYGYALILQGARLEETGA